MKEDAFDRLFVNEAEMNKELIVDILEPYIQMTKDGDLIPLARFENLTNEKKITLVLLSKKVMAAKNIASENTSPSEVQELTGLSKGTVNPTLMRLSNKGIAKNEGGKYQIPNYSVHRVKKMFKNREII